MFKAALILIALTAPAAAQQKGVVLYGMSHKFEAHNSKEQEQCDFRNIKDSKGKTQEIMRCYCYGASSDKDILILRKGA
jgi:hypothetical protein